MVGRTSLCVEGEVHGMQYRGCNNEVCSIPFNYISGALIVCLERIPCGEKTELPILMDRRIKQALDFDDQVFPRG